MPGHIIHKQTLNIGVATKDQAHNTGDIVRDVYVNKVLPELDQIFSALSPEDQVYRFDRIEIDLGTIPAQDFDAELPGRITQMVEEAVSETIEQARFHPPEGRKMEVIPVATSLFDAFIFYLEHGILPWWFKDQGKEPAQIFSEIPTNIQEIHVEKLKQAFQKEKTRIRLARQFSDDFIAGVLSQTHDTERKSPDKDDEAKPALFSGLLSELIPALEKLRVKPQVIEDFRLEMAKQMLVSNLAYAPFSPAFDTQKSKKPLDEFIASAMHILIFTLARHGKTGGDIMNMLNGIRDRLADKSMIRKWFRKVALSEDKIEQIIKSSLKKSSKENVEEEKADDTEKPYADDTGIYIRSGGVVLLWPFLKNYFHKLGLLAGEDFKSTEAQHRAVMLVQYAASGRHEFPEYILPLNKILCGFAVDEPVEKDFRLSEKEIKETEALIQSAIETWKAIGKVSVEGFRQSFLQREGRLQQTENGWSLKVERKTIDILLDKLPWMISMVKLKWMKQIIYVDW